MIQVIDISQKKLWNKYISGSLKYDFYHSWSYHSIDVSGKALLFVYQEREAYIALPLIKRRINNSAYFDLTSVYGYTGPVSNISFDEMSDEFIENFKNAFLEFLHKGRYVSVFSRLNPFLNQNRLLAAFGGLHHNGKSVVIDLTKTIEEQRSMYRKTNLRAVKYLREQGFQFKEVSSEKSIKEFAAIYRENMNRVDACEFYRFDDKYFLTLLGADDYVSKLFLVYYRGRPVSGAVASFTQDVMQIHLLATKTEFLRFSPAKLVVDEATIVARHLGMRYCHLGGGVGFKEDQLLNWKCGFSKKMLSYHSWRFVINEPIYNFLSNEIDNEGNSEVDFFPLYRYLPAVPYPSSEPVFVNLIS